VKTDLLDKLVAKLENEPKREGQVRCDKGTRVPRVGEEDAEPVEDEDEATEDGRVPGRLYENKGGGGSFSTECTPCIGAGV
jgi:hypothetical protein